MIKSPVIAPRSIAAVHPATGMSRNRGESAASTSEESDMPPGASAARASTATRKAPSTP